jgi:hypothetical protein
MKTPENQSHTNQGSKLIYVSCNPPKKSTDRKERIQSLIEQIQLGDRFKSSELKAALGSVAWAAFQQETATHAPSRKSPNAAGELRPYLETVRRADAKASKCGGRERHLSRKQRFKAGPAFRGMAAMYERALVLLEEWVEHYPGLEIWFDRPLVFGQLGDLTADADGMPRLLWSRSPYALTDGPRKELARVALTYLYEAPKTCGQPKSKSKSTLRPKTLHEVESDWIDIVIAPDFSESDPFNDLDDDLFRGLL